MSDTKTSTKGPKAIRDERVVIVCTAEEKAAIRKAALAEGRSDSEYARVAALRAAT